MIIIIPTELQFESGEIMKFNGTGLPNKSVEMVLEDPLGKEIHSEFFQTDESGYIEFEYKSDQSSLKGTYTLIVTQDKEKEFIFAGLGMPPTIPVNFEFDQISYKTSDTAIITLTGKASEKIKLRIIDPSEQEKGFPISITLQPDGRGTFNLDLTGYSSGLYTAVMSSGTSQSQEFFAVGLQLGSGDIKIIQTKLNDPYLPGDSILILGNTGENALISISLINPDGIKIREKNIFSTSEGRILESSFKVPTDAKPGIWTINAKSGANFHSIEIEVLGTFVEGMQVKVEEGIEIVGLGKSINIIINGATPKTPVFIEIFNNDNEIVDDSLKCTATADAACEVPWIILKNSPIGTYIVKVKNIDDSAETTFEVS